MKRLMTIAFAAVIAGGATYAASVYDYKASVKNVSLKTVRISCQGQTGDVAVKFIVTTSLYGYLVDECSTCPDSLDTQFQPNGHGYLVAANTKNKVATILPADLLAKMWPAKGNCFCGTGEKSWVAEGYLFVGWGKISRPFGSYDDWDLGEDWGAPSALLFGTFNRPDDSGDFYDAWLDASGFGKATAAVLGDVCGESSCTVLDSLSGSVIGGLFVCAPSSCEEVLCLDWHLTTDVVTGTWSIKRNIKLVGVDPNDGDSLGDSAVDALVNAAILKIQPSTTFGSVVPSSSTDFPRY